LIILKRHTFKKSAQVIICLTFIPTPDPLFLTNKLIISEVRLIASEILISKSNDLFGFDRLTIKSKSTYLFSYFNFNRFLIVRGICPNFPNNLEAAIYIS